MTSKRRGAGEGTVSLRADGRWVGAVTLAYRPPRVREARPGAKNPLDAPTKRAVVYGKTRREAVEKLDALKAQLKSGMPRINGRTTVDEYLSRWLEGVETRVRAATWRRYSGIVRHQLSPELGRIKLAELQPEDIDRMVARLWKGGLSPQTCAHVRSVLRAALTDAVKHHHVGLNAAKLSNSIRVPHQQPRVLSPEAARSVLEAVGDPGLRRLATVAIHTGLRQGELLGLRWEDVDHDGGDLHVSQAVQRVGGAYAAVEVKSANSRRPVPLTAPAREALAQERKAQLEARLAAGSRWQEPVPGLIFTTTAGQPRSGSVVTHAFAAALARAGLPAMRWHDLRHGFATLMLTSGSDLGTVSHLLGHSSLNLTLNTYGGIASSLKHEAADRMERLLSQTS